VHAGNYLTTKALEVAASAVQEVAVITKRVQLDASPAPPVQPERLRQYNAATTKSSAGYSRGRTAADRRGSHRPRSQSRHATSPTKRAPREPVPSESPSLGGSSQRRSASGAASMPRRNSGGETRAPVPVPVDRYQRPPAEELRWQNSSGTLTSSTRTASRRRNVPPQVTIPGPAGRGAGGASRRSQTSHQQAHGSRARPVPTRAFADSSHSSRVTTRNVT